MLGAINGGPRASPSMTITRSSPGPCGATSLSPLRSSPRPFGQLQQKSCAYVSSLDIYTYICASEEKNIYKQEIGMEAVVHSSAITLVTPSFCKYSSSFIQMFLNNRGIQKNPRFKAHNAILSTHCLASVRFCHSTKFSSLHVTKCHEKKAKTPSLSVLQLQYHVLNEVHRKSHSFSKISIQCKIQVNHRPHSESLPLSTKFYIIFCRGL